MHTSPPSTLAKTRLAGGALLLLLISFAFSSAFALMALTQLYTELLLDSGLSTTLIQSEIDAFSRQQLWLALPIVLGAGLLLLAVTAWRIPSTPAQWSLRSVGWPLFAICGPAQLLALGLYVVNFIERAPSTGTSHAALLDTLLEIGTTLLVAILLFFELVILLLKVLQAGNRQDARTATPVDPASMRPAVFLFLFGVDLSAAFVPLHMADLYQPLLGLPKDMVMGLPISAMFLSVSITIVVSGIWLDRRGWHEPFLTGVALVAVAKLYAWLAPSAVHFIAAMGMVGLGYGLTLMASQGFVIVQTDDKSKARGLAYLFAGIYAGSICGTAAGAMLAERIGYRPVFLLSAIIVFLLLLYTLTAMRGAIRQSKPRRDTASAAPLPTSVSARDYWNFLRNRHVLGLIFLSSLPSAIAVIGFLNFFGPVYLDRLGYSESTIGAVLILYGLCMVYLGPLLSHYIDRASSKRVFVIIGCLLGGCAFLSFYFFTGFVASVIAVVLLGLSSCLVLASQTTYALTLDVTKQLGQGRAIGLFRASSRLGQMIGPMLFGWLIITTDINQGITYFGLAYLSTAILFALVTREKPVLRQLLLRYRKAPAHG